MDLNLQGKYCYITGGGSGIGRAIAERFGAEGARVFVLDRDEEKGRETAESIEAEGGSAQFKYTDIAFLIRRASAAPSNPACLLMCW